MKYIPVYLIDLPSVTIKIWMEGVLGPGGVCKELNESKRTVLWIIFISWFSFPNYTLIWGVIRLLKKNFKKNNRGTPGLNNKNTSERCMPFFSNSIQWKWTDNILVSLMVIWFKTIKFFLCALSLNCESIKGYFRFIDKRW